MTPTGARRTGCRSAAPGSELLASARSAFLVDDPVADVVRGPILASWNRSRRWGVVTEHLQPPYDPDADDDTSLTRAADPVLAETAQRFALEPVSVVLCDANGMVLRRHTGEARLERQLDRVHLVPGFSYAEQHVGTNGIGTALEGGGPAQVFGHEHYVEHLEELACAGVPIRNPVTGKVVGVLDLTCWRDDAGRTMAAAAASIAAQIEETLLAQTGRKEMALLRDYLLACRRHRGIVLAIGPDLLMMNDRARELLEQADQAPLLATAVDALASGTPQQLVVDLPSGLTARLQCRPSFGSGTAVGGVVTVHLNAATAGEPRPVPLCPTSGGPLFVGSGASWIKCTQTVDRHLRSREWLVLWGEPGTGKTTVVRSTHRYRTPAALLRVLDGVDCSPQWLAEIAGELADGGGSLLLTHLDRIPPAGLRALADILEPHRESTDPERPWVVATVSRPEAEHTPELAALIATFPHTVEVPPLRHHVEDVTELVPHLLARLTRVGALRCSAEAMRVLLRHRWPGNVEQLHQVLRKVVARRRSGVVEARDLPPEAWAMSRHVLTPLEAIECDAIVDTLLDTGGNKAEAARMLGMSRATIYRKIRGYGITTEATGPLDPA